jgi:hypothetical protein
MIFLTMTPQAKCWLQLNILTAIISVFVTFTDLFYMFFLLYVPFPFDTLEGLV